MIFPATGKERNIMVFFGKSDVGMRRTVNQDIFACMRIWGGEAVLLAVCDGMGGHKAGEIASQKAISVFSDNIVGNPCIDDDPEKVCTYMRKRMYLAAYAANKAVYEMSNRFEELSGMGTTLVAAIIYGGVVYVINVGDSRAYIVSSREALQITRDHSFVQYLINEKKLTEEEAKYYPHKNVITRAIGINDTIEVDFIHANLRTWGTGYILLCSDGLTNYADKSDLVSIIAPQTKADRASPEGELARKTDRLIAFANKKGGGDNITAVLAKF